ncbi:MAG: hypothetical protein WKF37_10730 [Bryobacteraceae bacterium]
MRVYNSMKADAGKARLRRWLKSGAEVDRGDAHPQERTHPWYTVLWLTGVDYFSTLGYQPGIALVAAGMLAPVATAILVLVTLACALPIYAVVAKRSYAGQGSIAMLENLLPGWWGKFFVLALLGFAGTDFVITMTLSAADAAQHAIENPFLHAHIGEHRILLTLGLLLLLALVFLKGFREAIGLATFVAIPYLALTAVILVKCLLEVFSHPELIANWKEALFREQDLTGILIASALIFPRLALGLSGFETGVTVMPLIGGDSEDSKRKRPDGRIRNARKLLAAAAVIMSVMLLASSFATTMLISPEEYQKGGKASGRAIAFLAHEKLGNAFGTTYDIVTILILWFAGASAMAGLLNLIPRYLPRFGMAPHWVAYARPLVILLFLIDVVVTLIFKADVDAQGGAYATGVLVLMLSAAVAAALVLRKGPESSPRLSLYCWFVSTIFAYTLVLNVIERPDGVVIASIFILTIVVVGAVSRYLRAEELRVAGMEFADEESRALWDEIQCKKVHLAPYTPDRSTARGQVERRIRENYKVQGRFAFINVSLMDNRSEFLAPLNIKVRRDAEDLIVDVTQAVAIANAIAYVSEQLDPISIFLELSRRNVTTESLRFLIFGEGEVGLLVYSILLRHWETTPEDDPRPNIFIMSSADEPVPKSA